MSAIKKLMMTTAAGGELLAIEDVFSTYLWTSTGATSIDIVNGIDLATEGGMFWVKSRTNAEDHVIAWERGVDRNVDLKILPDNRDGHWFDNASELFYDMELSAKK